MLGGGAIDKAKSPDIVPETATPPKEPMKKLLLLLPIFIATLFITQSAYALDDISQTYSDGIQHVICASGPGWNGYTSCDGYNYITITSDGLSSNSVLQWNSSVNFGDIRIGNTDTIILNRALIDGDYLRFYLSNYSTGSYTVTLSEAFPGADCPTPPEPEPCPDCDEPAIVRLFKDGFWGVATALVALIVPILALFLVFRLVHDFFWGRG